MCEFQYYDQYEFPEDLKTASLKERIEYFESVRLKHKILEDVYNEVLSYLRIDGDFPLILISGSTGVGKSVLCEKITSTLNEDKNRSLDSDVICILAKAEPCVSAKRYNWRKFKLGMIKKYWNFVFPIKHKAEKLEVEKIILQASIYNAPEEIVDEIFELLIKRRNVKYLIIDEAKQIFQGRGFNDCLVDVEVIRLLAQNLNIKIVLAGTYHLLQYTSKGVEFRRRCQCIEFPLYTVSDEDDCCEHVKVKKDSKNNELKVDVEFLIVLDNLLRKYPAQLDVNLLKDEEFFFIISCGCVGILKTTLMSALNRSSDDDFKVDKEIIKSSAKSQDVLMNIVSEAKKIKQYFPEQKGFDGVRELLFSKSENSSSTSEKEPARKKGCKYPGRRKDVQDSVGIPD